MSPISASSAAAFTTVPTSSAPCGSEEALVGGAGRGSAGIGGGVGCFAAAFGFAFVAGLVADFGPGLAAGFAGRAVGVARALASGCAAADLGLAVVAALRWGRFGAAAAGSARTARFSLRRCGRECGSEPRTEASDLSLIAGLIVLTCLRRHATPGYALLPCMQYFQQAAFCVENELPGFRSATFTPLVRK